MNGYTLNKREENKDKLKSGIITAIIWSVLLLFVFYYKITEKIPKKKEVVARMLINFGDNRNGNGLEEPANQEGSESKDKSRLVQDEIITEEKTEPKVEEKPDIISAPKKEIPKAEAPKEKIITGNNAKVSTPKTETKKPEKATKAETKNTSKATSDKSSKPTTSSKAEASNSKTGTGDGKGNAAIGNLIKGRGTKPGTQGTNGTAGNAGDPLGGDGNGDSKIGIDRKLIGYIPGTMGRGGTQPSHSCSASGDIKISYTVDKAGNVISAKRSGGISDACVASTSIDWVKKYVKAEKATVSSTGIYTITF